MGTPRGGGLSSRLESGPPASARPTGTVMFLFSDIEGSTSRWDADREAMEAAVARHEQIINDAVRGHRGFVFKTVGDGFC